MNEIRLVSANNYGNGGLSFVDRQIYRYLLIPFTRKALLQQEKQFTWMERYVGDGKGGFEIEALTDVRFVPLLDGVAKEL